MVHPVGHSSVARYSIYDHEIRFNAALIFSSRFPAWEEKIRNFHWDIKVNVKGGNFQSCLPSSFLLFSCSSEHCFNILSCVFMVQMHLAREIRMWNFYLTKWILLSCLSFACFPCTTSCFTVSVPYVFFSSVSNKFCAFLVCAVQEMPGSRLELTAKS